MIHAISVCIIPYNDSLVFEKSLYSLIEALEFLDTFELMVLDNSTDKQHKDRNIEIIKNINNINILYYDEISSKKPAEAVSFFIKKARYDICLASADDVLFKKDSIKKAYEVITNHSGVAMVGFTSICYQSDFIIESQGSVISGCTTRVKDNNAGKRYILDTTRSLIKATHFRNSMMFKNTYGIDFDETFGFFYEESDFGLRLKKFGQIYCVSDAIIWHSLKIKNQLLTNEVFLIIFIIVLIRVEFII